MADFLFDLIGNIYDAATDQTLWPWVLGKLTELFGGGGASITFYDVAGQQVVDYVSAGLPDDAVKEYVTRLIDQDPRLEWALAHPAIATFFDRLHSDEAQMDKSEFYSWLGLRGFRYSIARQEFHDGTRACLALQRTRAQGHVQDADIAMFEQVAPHVLRSAIMARRLGGLDLSRASGEDAFERLAVGVVFLDANGRPIHANRAARDIAAANDGLSIGSDRVSAARRDDDTLLQKALADAITAARGGVANVGVGDVLSLGRPSGKRPLAIRVSPITRRRPVFVERQPAAILFVSDPEVMPAPPRALLKRAYKLTPRECDVALALASGQTLEQSAKAYGLARATVRVHLRSLLHKTGTHSQSALVRLLMATVPGLE
jgi:DNA-binding CsgD family transcriptional regulator